VVPQQQPGDPGRDREVPAPDGDPDPGRRPRPGDRGRQGPGREDERRPDAGTELPAHPPPTPLTQQLGRIVVVALLILFAAFAVVNSQRVDFSWVFGATEVTEDPSGQGTTGGVPLILLLLVTFAAGALLGVLVAWQVRRGRLARRERKGG